MAEPVEGGAASAYLGGSLVAQLPPATRARQCQVVQVPAQLEVLVAHPVRVLKIERDASQHRAKNTVRGVGSHRVASRYARRQQYFCLCVCFRDCQ
jgi:hypothetical protein